MNRSKSLNLVSGHSASTDLTIALKMRLLRRSPAGYKSGMRMKTILSLTPNSSFKLVSQGCLFFSAIVSLSILTSVHTAVAAPSCFNTLRVAAPQTAKATLATSATVFDFDGDGLSDLVSAKEGSSKTTFSIISSLDGTASSIELPAGKPVPADYDGDLKWDAAIVSKSNRGIKWVIQLSSNGQRIVRTFGKASSDVLYGCRFLSAGKYSLAILNERKLQAVELGSNIKRSISFNKLNRSLPIGCGDPTGDGIDELIVQTISPAATPEVSSVSCINDNVDYGAKGTGSNLFVLDLGMGEIPVIGRQRFNLSNKILIRLNVLYDRIRYPHFYLPKFSIFTFGKFASANTFSWGILWQNLKTNEVTKQLFTAPKDRQVIGTLGDGQTLVRQQALVRASSIP